MTNVMDISPSVEERINEIYEFYEAEVNTGIQERLGNFGNLRTGVPVLVHDCIATALNE